MLIGSWYPVLMNTGSCRIQGPVLDGLNDLLQHVAGLVFLDTCTLPKSQQIFPLKVIQLVVNTHLVPACPPACRVHGVGQIKGG